LVLRGDDGVGFDRAEVSAAGLGIGMGSMPLRIARVGGTLTIESHPGRTELRPVGSGTAPTPGK